MFKFSLTLFALLAFSVVEANKLKSLFADGTDPKDIHAVLVSGVSSTHDFRIDLNIALEAEIAQTYHLLLDNGVPANNIILFMDGGFANNPAIPTKDALYTDKNLSRNYNEGLKVDYRGDEEVTPENLLAVIRGEKDKVKGGSGRVLNSNEKTRVFISHESHGMSGYLCMNAGDLLVKDLHEALHHMEKKKMFKDLVYYVVACYSGSMFHGHLNDTKNIYALTAASFNESAYAYETVVKDGIEFYINTELGKAWLTDTITHDSTKETLEHQYEIAKPLVASHLSQWGNLDIANQDYIGDFVGKTHVKEVSDDAFEFETNKDPIPISQMADYYMLKSQINKALKSLNFVEHKELEGKLAKMEKEQSEMINKAHTIVQSLLDTSAFSSSNVELFDEIPSIITNLDCHSDVTKFIGKECQKLKKNTFFEKFYVPMVNLCEEGFDSQKIISEIQKYC